MIERDIEVQLVSKIKELLKPTNENDANIQIDGLWDYREDKGVQEDSVDGQLFISVQPRSYQTPTIPTCQIPIVFTLVMRAELDSDGRRYYETCDKLMTQFERWQKCLCDSHLDMTVPNEFEVTGYQLNGGQSLLDKTNKTWNYSQEMVVFGVVQTCV